MKCTICWLEYHNPENWADEKLIAKRLESKGFNEKLEEKIEKSGIKNIIESLPTKQWGYDGNDGWIEVECVDTFEAKDIEEAKKKANEYDTGDSCLSVLNSKTKELLFTEEDLLEDYQKEYFKKENK